MGSSIAMTYTVWLYPSETTYCRAKAGAVSGCHERTRDNPFGRQGMPPRGRHPAARRAVYGLPSCTQFGVGIRMGFDGLPGAKVVNWWSICPTIFCWIWLYAVRALILVAILARSWQGRKRLLEGGQQRPGVRAMLAWQPQQGCLQRRT